MRTYWMITLGLVLLGATALAQDIPPAEESARDRLNTSPRHGEWIKVDAGKDGVLNAWVAFPERKDKAPVVVVIHEIYGLTDWIRSVTDQLASDGFLAVAPDLLSGKGPEGGGTDSVDRDGATKLIRGLDPGEVTRRITATAEHAMKLPAAQKKFATVGFCWGGSTSFRYATQQTKLSAAVVYYGDSPDTPLLATIQAPILGLYGGNDERVNATISPADAEMKKLGKRYELEIFEGAGHGFLRAQAGQEGANLRASQKAWPRTIGFLKSALGGHS